jgi:phosphocarrier protein
MGLLNRKPRSTKQPLKIEKELTVINPQGLHMRPAALFVRIASRYRCEVWVSKEGEEVNGKSIVGLMMLTAGQGSKLKVRCEGVDADKAMEEVIASVIEVETGERVFSVEDIGLN